MALVLVALAVASVAEIPEAIAQTDRAEPTPVVAVVVPLDGEFSAMGRQLVESARLAAGDAGVRIEEIDEGESVADMVRSLHALEGRSEVIAIVGPVRRDRAPPAARVATRLEIPLFAFTPSRGIERRSRWVVRVRPSPGERAERVADNLIEQRGTTRIGVVGPRNRYGNALIPALIEAIDRRGGVVVSTGRYQEETTDFRPVLEVLTGVRARIGEGRTVDGRRADRHGTVEVRPRGEVNFEALVIADSHQVVAQLLPFLPRVGISTPAAREGQSVQLAGVAHWRGDGLERAGGHAEGAVFFDVYGGAVDGGSAADFARRFEDATGRTATTPEAEIYDVVALIGDVIEARTSGPNPRTELLESIQSQSLETPATGSWQFDRYGAPRNRLNTYQVTEGGGWVGIDGRDR